ncbi:MAG: thiamine-phosphate kinase [Parvibaculales bacterium]
MKESEWIEKLLAPLAGKPALGLCDDAAILPKLENEEWIVSTDALLEGVHYPKGLGGKDIARRLIASNLSDLAAKGARPKGYFLTFIANMPDKEAQAFVRVLEAYQQQLGWELWGGDSVSGDIPMFSLTVFGTVPYGKMIKRSTAKEGDSVFVSGTIGDAYIGRLMIEGKIKDQNAFLKQRFLQPTPRNGLGEALIDLAHSAIDISDGLLADIGKIALSSNVEIELRKDAIPISSFAKKYIENGKGVDALLRAGDDYEIAFTIDPHRKEEAFRLAKMHETDIHEIGQVTKATKAPSLSIGGKVYKLANGGAAGLGYQHILSL